MGRKRKKKRYTAKKDGTSQPAAVTKAPEPVVEEPGTYETAGAAWWVHLLACVVLVAGTWFFYQGDLDLGFFHLDDPSYVTLNRHIQGFTGENLRFVLTQPYAANYSPVHLLSYMVDFAVAGETDARTFHASSNLWGGLVAAMVYLCALFFVRKTWVAFLAGLLFVFHPSHIETIVWISSRKDLVAAAFTLPAIAAYFKYRQGGAASRKWYIASLVLFLLGLAGKLSVVVVPGILFLFDYLYEGRRDKGMFLDKIPYALLCVFFALRVMVAQPTTRNPFEWTVFGHSTLYNLWLLTGFGEYGLSRGRPDLSDVTAFICILAVPLVFLVPLALRRWVAPVVLAFGYWVVLALVPSQVLSFIHPVTDRYLFFPSAGVVILLAWAMDRMLQRWKKPGWVGILVVTLLLGGAWATKAKTYLEEWQDPRSVWYGAQTKSDDVSIPLYLGTHYHDMADQLAFRVGKEGGAQPEDRALAERIWEGDERLPQLISEWDQNQRLEVSRAYEAELRDQAKNQLEEAARRRVTRLLPNLYFRLGKIAMDTGNYPEAVKQFLVSYNHAERHSSQDIKRELSVRTYHAIGLVYWRMREYDQAKTYISQAETWQQQWGGRWVPDIAQHRQRLEGLAK